MLIIIVLFAIKKVITITANHLTIIKMTSIIIILFSGVDSPVESWLNFVNGTLLSKASTKFKPNRPTFQTSIIITFVSAFDPQNYIPLFTNRASDWKQKVCLPSSILFLPVFFLSDFPPSPISFHKKKFPFPFFSNLFRFHIFLCQVYFVFSLWHSWRLYFCTYDLVFSTSYIEPININPIVFVLLYFHSLPMARSLT